MVQSSMMTQTKTMFTANIAFRAMARRPLDLGGSLHRAADQQRLVGNVMTLSLNAEPSSATVCHWQVSANIVAHQARTRSSA